MSDRDQILSRRARFVALALAASGVVVGSQACVCLSVAPPPPPPPPEPPTVYVDDSLPDHAPADGEPLPVPDAGAAEVEPLDGGVPQPPARGCLSFDP
jgi:hypothetical protein